MTEKKIHLVCNAHLDPVWLWEWQEGAGEALSTFRTAAEFCDDFEGFVFCHNEAILYKWVEDYEPALFRRIQKLVKQKKWNILGGWYLQPDCNMPSGESFVRQILLGKRYFKEKFGVDVKTASNLDPFGHTRGLVQIMAKAGYDSYLFCRPGQADCPLPADEFIWVGLDGSEVLAHRASSHYNTYSGKARAKVEGWIKNNAGKELGMILWGIGDHGGGPSRRDLKSLEKLRSEVKDVSLVHSTPAAFFKELGKKRAALPRHEKDINPWAPGCYTSMIRVKQKHRLLENELYSAEKMAAHASSLGLAEYPRKEFEEAMMDLAFAEFHDILPGSCIPAGEEGALRLLGHGLEILSRVKAKSFFALSSGQPKGREGEIPILVYNPHPFQVEGIIECEFEPSEPNFGKTYLNPRVYQKGAPIPSQAEKEQSNLNAEWRKKVVFEAVLKPSSMNRFDCRLEELPSKPRVKAPGKNAEGIEFRTGELEVRINGRTGLLDVYRANGADYLGRNAFQPLVMSDDADPWGMKVRRFRDVEGRFNPACPDESAGLSGQPAPLSPVRIIQDGDARTVVEAILVYRGSFAVLTYKLPKKGTEIEVECRVLWNEKDRMLKLSLPVPLAAARYLGQVAYGTDELPANGDEAVAQKWVAVVSQKDGRALTVANDGAYGSDYAEGELRLTLLRSPAYSADVIPGKGLAAEGRFIPRMDQGEHCFRFWLSGGPLQDRLDRIDRESLTKNEKPYVLPFFPSGDGAKIKPGVTLSDGVAQVTVFKKAEDSSDLIIRLYEPTGRERTTTLALPFAGAETKVRLRPFEIKTLRFNNKTKAFKETDLLEKPLR